MKKASVYTLFAAGLGLVLSTNAIAQPTATLQDAIQPGFFITENNLTFSDFTYSSATMPANQVTLGTPEDGSFGLVFNANWDTNTSPIMDSVIGYKVTIANSTLTNTALHFGATVTGGATASVGESIFDVTNNKDYHLQVLAGTNADTSSASVDFSPASTELLVSKDLVLAKDPTTAGSRATVSFFDNTYTAGSGSTPPIPEPMSLALIPLGLAGLGLRKKFARS